MLGLPDAAKELAHLRTAKTRIKGLNSLKQLLGIALASLLACNIKRIQQAVKVARVEREQTLHARMPLILPSR